MDYEAARKALVRHLARHISDQRVLRVMADVPREIFLPLELRGMAYDDKPLPIGHGQTISQPYIVGIMTQALKLSGVEKVLELGTGSGYQACILSHLASQVVTVERVAALAEQARKTLGDRGCRNVEVRLAGETLGCQERSPYDAIIVTAAAPMVPQALLDQVVLHGRIVIPVGTRESQDLMLATRTERGIARERLGLCRFVPLLGAQAWQEE